jgi:hypothetical protein
MPKHIERLSRKRAKEGPKKDWAFLFIVCAMIIVAVGMSAYESRTDEPEPITPQPSTINDRLESFTHGVLMRMSQGGCTGSYRWFTGRSFSQDAQDFKEEYGMKYSMNPTDFDAANIYPPAALTLLSPDAYDCKDAFMAALCLAAYYPDVHCVPYYEAREGGEHVGLDCVEIIGNITYQTRF